MYLKVVEKKGWRKEKEGTRAFSSSSLCQNRKTLKHQTTFPTVTLFESIGKLSNTFWLWVIIYDSYYWWQYGAYERQCPDTGVRRTSLYCTEHPSTVVLYRCSTHVRVHRHSVKRYLTLHSQSLTFFLYIYNIAYVNVIFKNL